MPVTLPWLGSLTLMVELPVVVLNALLGNGIGDCVTDTCGPPNKPPDVAVVLALILYWFVLITVNVNATVVFNKAFVNPFPPTTSVNTIVSPVDFSWPGSLTIIVELPAVATNGLYCNKIKDSGSTRSGLAFCKPCGSLPGIFG